MSTNPSSSNLLPKPIDSLSLPNPIVAVTSTADNVFTSSSTNIDYLLSTLRLDSATKNNNQTSSQQATSPVQIQQTSGLIVPAKSDLISSSSQIKSFTENSPTVLTTTDTNPIGTSKLSVIGLSITQSQPISSVQSSNHPTLLMSSHVSTMQYPNDDTKTSAQIEAFKETMTTHFSNQEPSSEYFSCSFKQEILINLTQFVSKVS